VGGGKGRGSADAIDVSSRGRKKKTTEKRKSRNADAYEILGVQGGNAKHDQPKTCAQGAADLQFPEGGMAPPRWSGSVRRKRGGGKESQKKGRRAPKTGSTRYGYGQLAGRDNH